MDRVPPSEGGGCPFEPGREHDSDDERLVHRALVLAAQAAAAGDVPIGAVLIAGGRTFEARNEKESRPDPTAHAEMLAIRAAADALGAWRVGGTLYVTKEPCVMCAGAIAAARIERLVFGCADPKGGAAGSVIDALASAALNHRVSVTAGVLERETAQQLRDYFRAKRQARPASAAGSAAIATRTDVRAVVPFLKVSDMRRSVHFYVDRAGFTIAERWDVGGELRWCRLVLGDASLMLQQFPHEGHDAWTASGPVGEGVVLYFICADALAIYRDLIAAGADAAEPRVGNGMWETGTVDPDGYALRFESVTDVPDQTKLSDLA